MREYFEYALENLNVLATTQDDDKELVDKLGQHLYAYYIWRVYPLTGDESLLERFYNKNDEDRSRWAELFDHVGQSLANIGIHLEKELVDRTIAFFDWRFDAAEPLELHKFTRWLEAECLDPEWRLKSLSRILDLTHEQNMGPSIEVSALTQLLSDHLPLVVECFKKFTECPDHTAYMYILIEDAKPILNAGLKAEDPQIRENAERARENLLRIGRFDFLNLD